MRSGTICMAVAGSVAMAASAGAAATPAPLAKRLPLTGGARDEAIRCMAEAISYEAGHEPENGQMAVAQVILNRLASPAFPKTVCGVVYQGSERRTGCQFTFTCDGSMARWKPGALWPAAVRIATLAVDGDLLPTVGDALNYHADYVQPAWAAHLVRVAKIGAHIFYGPGAPGEAATPPAPGATAPGATAPRTATLTLWGLPAATLTRIGGTVSVQRY